MKFLKPLVLVLFVIGSTSCASLGNVFSTPDVRVSDARIAEIDFEHITLDFDFLVDNRNFIGLEMAGFDYAIEIEGHSLVKGESRRPLSLAPNDTSTVGLPVTFLYKDIAAIIKNIVSKDTLTYTLKAVFRFDAPIIGEVTCPLEFTASVPVLKVPKISIDNLTVKNMSFLSLDFELAVLIENPNAFNFTLEQFDYQFTVNNSAWASGALPEVGRLEKKDRTMIIIPFSIKSRTIGMDMLKLIKSNSTLSMNFLADITLRADNPLFPALKHHIDAQKIAAVLH